MYCIQVLQTIEGEQKHLFRRKSGGALNGGKFVTTPTSDSVRASTEPIFQNHSKRLVFKQKCYLYQSCFTVRFYPIFESIYIMKLANMYL